MYKYELNGLKVKAKFELNGEELSEIKKAIIKKYSNEKIDGFRKGNAPIDLIEKTFKKQIDSEILNEVINSQMTELVKEKDFKVLSTLNVEDYSLTNDNVTVNVMFEIFPEVKLPEYKGLNINVDVKKVEKEDVDKAVENILSQNKTKVAIENRDEAMSGDIANINFEGFVDGVAFEGGKSENYDLKLGSKSFIDTFEDQIVGKKIGSEFDVNVTFPEEYHAENLKGKPAVFKIKLNSLKEEKEAQLDEELAKKYGFESVEAFLDDIKANLEKRNEKEADEEKFGKIADHIVENIECELPETLVEDQKNGQIQNIVSQMSQSGITLDKYLEMIGKTKEEFEQINLENAKKSVKYNFAIQEIAKIEDIKVEKEEIEAELEKVASMYGLTKEQLIDEAKKMNMLENYFNQIHTQLFLNKIKEFLVQNN